MRKRQRKREREREMKYNRVNEVEGLYSYTLYLEKAVTYNFEKCGGNCRDRATVKVEQAQYAP